jgi:hypothetical protein
MHMKLLCHLEKRFGLYVSERIFVFECQVNVLVDELKGCVNLPHKFLWLKGNSLFGRNWPWIKHNYPLVILENA